MLENKKKGWVFKNNDLNNKGVNCSIIYAQKISHCLYDRNEIIANFFFYDYLILGIAIFWKHQKLIPRNFE